MLKDTAWTQPGYFITCVKAYGARHYIMFGEKTRSLIKALEQMRTAFDDDERFETVQIRFEPDDRCAARKIPMTMTKKMSDGA